jgi:cytochrome c biogenesis protein CcmG, thiol:disulfide interchange protein DsbE
MKRALLSVMCLFVANAVAGPDLSSFAEGDASKRERLKALESGDAPPLDVSNWINLPPATLATLKGKIVVLDFWATWCGPCIAGIPHTNELAEKFKDKVVVIGVCHPQGGENMEKMVKDKGIKYPVCLDTNGKPAKAYGVDGFPDYYIIDAAGKLVLADCANGSVEKALEALLK